MKTIKIPNVIKAILLAVSLLFTTNAFSATYYVCAGATLNLSVPTAPTGTHYTWDIKQGGVSISGYPSTSTPTTVPTAGTYEIILNTVVTDPVATPTICAPDPVTNNLTVLPALSIALAAPSIASYCASSSTTSSNITQTSPSITAPTTTDIAKEYRYTVSKDGAAAVDGATLGTIDQGTGRFTLTTSVAGSYVVTGYVKYVKLAASTASLLGTTGCEVASTITQQTITVTPKPAQPVITFAIN